MVSMGKVPTASKEPQSVRTPPRPHAVLHPPPDISKWANSKAMVGASVLEQLSSGTRNLIPKEVLRGALKGERP